MPLPHTQDDVPSVEDARRWTRVVRGRRWSPRTSSFRSTLHSEKTAAYLGVALGVAFTILLVTGDRKSVV